MLSLIIGFSMKQLWWGVVLVFLSVAFFWIGDRLSWQWVSFVAFGAQLILSVGGVILGLSPFLMVSGAVTALGAWDLADLQKNSPHSSHYQLVKKFQLSRFRLLSLTLITGLIISELGLLVKFTIPFVLLFLCGFLILFSLYGLFKIMKN
jgi:hypothetical protein